ncbi:MAG: DUF4065 domain-containing protein [Tepidisphaera sp.]|nr:DUF4065 domain-containing protein [Tepidisphaera sp.]
MATVFDVAEYVLQKRGEMTAMKLQKLIYYCQAWSLVWDEEPLFSETIQAWANGPVVRALYEKHRGKFKVRAGEFGGDFSRLSDGQKESIDSVLKAYGDKSSQWLSDLSHMEEPWKSARKDLRPGERGEAEISHASMVEYYQSLPQK